MVWQYFNTSKHNVNNLFNDIQCFNDSFLFLLKTKIQSDLFKLNASSDTIQEFSKIFHILSNPFYDVKTEYFRLQTLECMGFLIRPHEVVIGQILNDRLLDVVVVLEPKVVKLTMVSLKVLLKKQLEHLNFFDIIFNYLNTIQENDNPHIISSFLQSNLWKIKSTDPNQIVLPLFLYYDDFEITNPLGSHAGVQKVGAVYVSLACLPPDLASRLHNIFLVSLFKTDNKSCFGNSVIFKEIIAVLNFSETSGMDILVGNKSYKIFFKLGLILGDNLGWHSILGFVEIFIAKYPCRFYETPKHECQSKQNKMIIV